MKTKRFRIGLAILVVAIVGVVLWQVLRLREPVYNGKPISYWIDASGRMFTWSDPPDSFFKGFPLLDSNAVPFLARALQREDGRLRVAYQNAWLRSPTWLHKRLPRPIREAWVRRAVAQALGNLARDAKPAIPALVRTWKTDSDPAVRKLAGEALVKIDHGAGAKATVNESWRRDHPYE